MMALSITEEAEASQLALCDRYHLDVVRTSKGNAVQLQ